jgi:hypothetical protein
MTRTASLVVIAGLLSLSPTAPTAQAQQPSKDLSSQEQALCRSDAIRLCFFKISDAAALRACLRSNKADLSAPCRKMIESRGF